jgi:hypothetical protein
VVAGRSIRLAAVSATLLALTGQTACQATFGIGDVTRLRLRNDLGVPVTLVPCTDDACEHLDGRSRASLPPGESLEANVSTDGAAQSYRVDRPGSRPRCVRLIVDGTPTRRVVQLSGAVDCASLPRTRTSLAATVLAWTLFAAVGGCALVATVLVTRRSYARLRRSAEPDARAGALAALLGLATFAGGWIPVGLVWLGRRATARRRDGAEAA